MNKIVIITDFTILKLQAHLVSALFLTHLTIPSQFLETFGLYPVAYRLRGEKICFPHCNQQKQLEKTRYNAKNEAEARDS